MTDRPAELRESDRFIVTGASGWLGRSALAVLSRWIPEPEFGSRVIAYGRTSRDIDIDGRTYEIRSLADADSSPISSGRTWLIHLAFLTRGYSKSMVREDYLRLNLELISAALRLAHRHRVAGVVTVSSGAAAGAHDGPAEDVLANPYGFLKLCEEGLFAEYTRQTGAVDIGCRLWGASGYDVQQPRVYALGDFVVQALQSSAIHVWSEHEVWRRYVDSRQLMELLLRLALAGMSVRFDSGGSLVEVAELARLVATACSHPVTVTVPARAGEPDRAYPAGSAMEEMMEGFGMQPMSLAAQVGNTVNGMMTTFASGIN